MNKIKLSDFLKPVKEIINITENNMSVFYSYLEQLSGYLQEYSFSVDYSNYIVLRVMDIATMYGAQGYHFIPMDYSVDIKIPINALTNRITDKVLECMAELSLFNYSLTSNSLTEKISPFEQSTIIHSKTIENIGNNRKQDDVETLQDSDIEEKIIEENSPINGSTSTITTPSFKRFNTNQGTVSSHSTTSKTEELSDTTSDTGNLTNKKESPYEYEKYLELSAKYHIYKILENAFKFVLYEYNKAY